MTEQEREGGAILYIASRLPALSETFVFRELLGLRERGLTVHAASVRASDPFPWDERLEALRHEATVVYDPATTRTLPLALFWRPGLTLAALADAATSDHPSMGSRAKHALQALMGIGAAWRLRKKNIRQVHAHMAHVPATVGLYIARALGAKFSFTGHAADLFADRAGLAFKLRRASFVSCISHWHQSFYGDVAGVAAERLPVIRCSVALPETIRPEAREVVVVARLVPKKGIDLLIRAFAQAELSGWRLVIAGDGPERAGLEALALELGIAERTEFRGAQPHAKCLEAIAAGGIFVLPCRTATNGDKDGIPVVLMEAMAAGRSVISGDLPAIRELIEDQVSGLLVPPDDVPALGRAIRRLAGDAPLRQSLAAAARARIEEEFCDAVNLDRLTGAFAEAAA
ncbi:glycosyltransferase family 4 protein [Sphingomonas sp.]|uniref:glycosyltransferase family 4 protein n=1 Tax=Sphingomonas sp. TaxID=28214 RepID=UPI001B17ABC4|nr:glycosyltransferase family 4 protein [Sphingomonas sp.]MBO9714535.1 glycosyltransferase family 4 protein [Sphingomonas sp.]